MHFRLCKAVMDRHLQERRGFPAAAGASVGGPQNEAIGVQRYQRWLADLVNPGSENNLDAIRKWFNGSSRPPPNKLPDLYRAFKLDPASTDPEDRHLMWELQVITSRVSMVEKTWYSPSIDARRLRLKEHFGGELAPHMASEDELRLAHRLAADHDTLAASVNQTGTAAAQTSALSAQWKRSIKLLADARASDLLKALNRQTLPAAAGPGITPTGRDSTRTAELLLQDLRGAALSNDKAAMQAVVRAVQDLRHNGPSLDVASQEHTCRAATQVFMLFLHDYAAQPVSGNAAVSCPGRLAFARTDNPLAAALLAECGHLGGEIRFVYPATVPDGRLFAMEHVLAPDDPGVLPGFDAQSHKGDLETRIKRELSGVTALPDGVPLIRPQWSDEKLRGFIDDMAGFHDKHFRFLVDVSHADGDQRLEVARQLHDQIGLAVVAYGNAELPPSELAHCGSVRPGAGSIDSLLVMLLSALHQLKGH